MITHKKGMNINYECIITHIMLEMRMEQPLEKTEMYEKLKQVEIQNSFSLSVSIAQYIKVIYVYNHVVPEL